MTKKDYEHIASGIISAYQEVYLREMYDNKPYPDITNGITLAMIHIIAELQRENERFNAAKFMEAIETGIQQYKSAIRDRS